MIECTHHENSYRNALTSSQGLKLFQTQSDKSSPMEPRGEHSSSCTRSMNPAQDSLYQSETTEVMGQALGGQAQQWAQERNSGGLTMYWTLSCSPLLTFCPGAASQALPTWTSTPVALPVNLFQTYAFLACSHRSLGL